jgi:hypothetical protein
VTVPRVNDKRTDPETGERQRFASAILPPWARKTPKIRRRSRTSARPQMPIAAPGGMMPLRR